MGLDRATVGLSDVHKSFQAVKVLRGVSFEVRAGEVVGLLGDNGAGKSTIVRCLSGALVPDRGNVLLNSAPVRFDSPMAARAAGIETVHQSLALNEALDIAQNIFVNREPGRRGLLGRLGWIDRRTLYEQADAALRDLGIDVPSVRSPIHKLSGGQRQAIAVARAALWGRRFVLLDEPIAALGVVQANHVLELIRTLSGRGTGVLLISHNMHHVLASCDRAMVLSHGTLVATVDCSRTDANALAELVAEGVRARLRETGSLR